NMLFLAMLGFYFLLSVLDFKYWIRIFGSVAFAFSTFNLIIIGAGHITEMMSMAFIAPVLGGIILTYRGKLLLGGSVTALMTAILIYNDHLQIMYYTLIMIICLAVGYGIHAYRQRQMKQYLIASVILIFAAVLAILPASDNLLVTKEFTKYSTRGSQSTLTLTNKMNNQESKGGLNIDYAFQWSYGKMETFTLLVPGLFGGSNNEKLSSSSHIYKYLSSIGVPPANADQAVQSMPTYWGNQPFTSGPVYFGAIICFLFVLSFFLVKSWEKWWWIGAAFLGIILSWGKNLPFINNFLFYHLPLYNKFRSPSMALVIPQVAFVFLASWTLNEFMVTKMKKEEVWKGIRSSFYITGGIVLVLTSGILFDFRGPGDPSLLASFTQQLGGNADMAQKMMNALIQDRVNMLHSDGLRSFVIILLVVGALWAYLKGKIKLTPFVTTVAILLIIDLFQVDKRYLNDQSFVDENNYAGVQTPSPADLQILQDKDPYYRVLNLSQGISQIFNGDALTSYFHHSIGGYSPAKLWRYQDLIDFQIQPQIEQMVAQLQTTKTLDSTSLGIFSSSPVLNMLNTKYFIINPNSAPVENNAALGNAWFVDSVEWVPNANHEMEALSQFDPKTEVIIDQKFKKDLAHFHPVPNTKADIHLTEYGLNELKYTSQNNQDGLAVFSDIYYPAGWKAYMDGKELPIIRVDYALRGLKIPAGNHQIIFKFHPTTYFLGQQIALYSSLGLILLSFSGIFIAVFKERGKEGILKNPDFKRKGTENQ
ncbi:MAG: YfhO family protein, partial [Chitinophagaceae bacterium]